MTIAIVTSFDKELRTDSRLLAEMLDHRHRTILENIDKNIELLKELNPIPFQTETGKALAQGGFAKPVRYALLTEDQCYFILTLMRNNDKVVRAKLNLVKAFSDARAQLAKRDLARIESKTVRAIETNAIQRLVDYANGAGSKNAEMYYQNVTRMTNQLLGIVSGKRDCLDAESLEKLMAVEKCVDIAIRDGLKAKMDYKDIYKLAKERATTHSESLKLPLTL